MDFNNLLNLALEVEGLVMLRQQRGADAPAQLLDLIRSKVEQMAAAVAADSESVAESAAFEEMADAQPAPEASTVTENPEEEVETFITEAEENPQQPDAPAHAAVGEVERLFTLNDKFRFRRELFGNSNEDFTETLDVLRAMDSIDEAEDYLYNDLAWNPENPDVKDFIALISPFYNRK